MAEVDTIDIPDVAAATRTVATMSKALKTAGLPTDDKSTATDTTSVTHTSIFKQLSAYLGTIAGAVGSSKVATKAAAADFADGSVATLGLKADAKSTATDTTAITLMQVAKQISASVQALVAAIPTALGRTTQAASLSVVQASFEYETVAASQSDQILGATGGVGDYLEGLLCVVATAATSIVQIKDGNGSAITVLPNAVGAGIGTYYVPIGLLTVNATTPGWKITTGAGVSVIGTGKFT